MQPATIIGTNKNAGHRLYDGTPNYHAAKILCATPQAKKVYELLQRDGRVTRLTALHYGVANVTARVAELRRLGIAVECEVVQDAEGREYGRWFLSK